MYNPLDALLEFIRSAYLPDEKVKESKNGEKTIFFRKGGKSLCYITDSAGKSTVTVVIGSSLEAKVRDAQISEKAKKLFLNSKEFHDGRWLFFELNSKEDVADIKTLLKIKKKPLKV